MNMNYWTPAGANRVQTKRPNEGDVVAYARAAWRVEHVQDATPTDEEAAALAAYRPGFRDKLGPYRVSLRRLHGPRHAGERRSDPGLLALRVRAGAYVHPFPVYRSGRVPLCSCCGDPWPCLPQSAEDEASQAARDMDRLARRAEMGVCFGCGEPVTSRQKVIVYPEPNAQVPLAPGPVFHARAACRAAVLEYERARAKVTPGVVPMVDASGSRHYLH